MSCTSTPWNICSDISNSWVVMSLSSPSTFISLAVTVITAPLSVTLLTTYSVTPEIFISLPMVLMELSDAYTALKPFCSFGAIFVCAWAIMAISSTTLVRISFFIFYYTKCAIKSSLSPGNRSTTGNSIMV